MTEYERMHKGLIYDSISPEIEMAEKKSHKLCEKYNKINAMNDKKREKLLRKMFPDDDFGDYRTMVAPIFLDNYKEMKIGRNFYSNFHLAFITGGTVEIGHNVFIGPYCTLAAGTHSLVAEERRIKKDENGVLHDFEYGKHIKIGNDVWLAANVTVCGGVTIGDGTVIGAGSVVTKDIPAGVLAAGNPCRVIREIKGDDSIYLKVKRD